ncbi:uncharacterized protein SRS1_10492 [Sporisorium reilianum f. sp. reilianum]|uniref:Transmembrane protein n=1 Tax=Sporisorium reilianum f. sp. reilianum TaxID=72559 RepID=A0A2N8U9R2_9BASI|nr:uncharacterized protein SRS1_10492 [Sporisorium reilianum f. sp. reilianum]
MTAALYIPPSFGQPGMAVLPMVVAAAAVRRTMMASTVRVGVRSARPMATSSLRVSPVGAQRSLVPGTRSYLGIRTLTSTPISRTPTSSPTPPDQVLATYEGPLARTFTRLKLFSLGSLGMASVLTPVLLLAPGDISLAGRIGLCVTALATSGVSTALIAWIGTPYVGTMRLLRPQPTRVAMELTTVSWRLKPQRTLVYEPSFLRPTSRPFAVWEISNSAPAVEVGGEAVENVVAETFDVKTGASLGRWIVRYDPEAKTKGEDGVWKAVGTVQVQGRPTRYFNVHEELLDEDWQVLG